MKLWLNVGYLLASACLLFFSIINFRIVFDLDFFDFTFAPMVLGLMYLCFGIGVLNANILTNISLSVFLVDLLLYYWLSSLAYNTNSFFSFVGPELYTFFLYCLMPIFLISMLFAIAGLIIALKEEFSHKIISN